MTIRVNCRCGSAFGAKLELAGKTVRCPRCQAALTIPRPSPGPSGTTPQNRTAGPIRVRCQCGRAFQAKPALSGKRVACPGCSSPLVIPHSTRPPSPAPAAPAPAAQAPARPSAPPAAPATPTATRSFGTSASGQAAGSSAPAAAIKVTCRCGKSFAAKPHLWGRRVACPACRAAIQVPVGPSNSIPSAPAMVASAVAAQPSAPSYATPAPFEDDELQLASGPDPLGSPQDDLFGDAVATSQGTLAPKPKTRRSVAAPRRRRNSSPIQLNEDKTSLGIGVACILFAGYRVFLHLYFWRMFGGNYFAFATSSLSGFLALVGIGLTIGFFLVGIGLVLGIEGVQGFGLLVGVGHIALVVINGLMILSYLNPEMMSQMGRYVPRIALSVMRDLIIPVSLIYEAQRD